MKVTPTTAPKDYIASYPLYAELPGWMKDAIERARKAGGDRSKRAWLERTLTKSLAKYRNDHD